MEGTYRMLNSTAHPRPGILTSPISFHERSWKLPAKMKLVRSRWYGNCLTRTVSIFDRRGIRTNLTIIEMMLPIIRVKIELYREKFSKLTSSTPPTKSIYTKLHFPPSYLSSRYLFSFNRKVARISSFRDQYAMYNTSWGTIIAAVVTSIRHDSFASENWIQCVISCRLRTRRSIAKLATTRW